MDEDLELTSGFFSPISRKNSCFRDKKKSSESHRRGHRFYHSRAARNLLGVVGKLTSVRYGDSPLRTKQPISSNICQVLVKDWRGWDREGEGWMKRKGGRGKGRKRQRHIDKETDRWAGHLQPAFHALWASGPQPPFQVPILAFAREPTA